MLPQKKNGLLCKSYRERRCVFIFGIGGNGTKPHLTIGITGCNAGVGVTHLAIALANLCGSKLGAKTACIEFHKRDEIRFLMTESRLSFRQQENSCRSYFRIYDVDYYPNASKEELPCLLNQGYQYLILDLGNAEEADFSELLRCDKKIIIGNPVSWKIDKFRKTLTRITQNTTSGEGFLYLIEMGKPKILRELSSHYHIQVRSVPFIPNPFRIEKEAFSVLQELLE